MTADIDIAAAPMVDEIHLLGVPPLANYVGHVTRRAISGRDADESALIDQWRGAAQHYQRLQESEAGQADLVEMSEIPTAKAGWIKRVASHADFAEGFGDLPVAFAMVELDRLVVFQQHVSLTHAATFTSRLEAAACTEDAVFSICLPEEPAAPLIFTSQSGRGKFVFQSDLSDVRAFSPRLFSKATAGTILTSNGHAVTGVALAVGFGARHLNIVRLGKRMVLNNGYHRAYALRAAGVTHVPCVIQAISHPEELAFAGGSSLIDNFDDLFNAPRPPLLKDFFDPKLTTLLKLPRTRKQIQVSINVETLRVPG